jgi:hypothetical protein
LYCFLNLFKFFEGLKTELGVSGLGWIKAKGGTKGYFLEIFPKYQIVPLIYKNNVPIFGDKIFFHKLNIK